MINRNDYQDHDHIAIEREARRLRAEAFADLIAGIGRRIAALAAGLRGLASRAA